MYAVNIEVSTGPGYAAKIKLFKSSSSSEQFMLLLSGFYNDEKEVHYEFSRTCLIDLKDAIETMLRIS